jgi:hypothetical protein
MDEMKKDHPHTDYKKDHGRPDRPYWKRAHYDWKFWVAILLMLFAMAIYLRSNDLSVRPGGRTQQPVP